MRRRRITEEETSCPLLSLAPPFPRESSILIWPSIRFCPDFCFRLFPNLSWMLAGRSRSSCKLWSSGKFRIFPPLKFHFDLNLGQSWGFSLYGENWRSFRDPTSRYCRKPSPEACDQTIWPPSYLDAPKLNSTAMSSLHAKDKYSHRLN